MYKRQLSLLRDQAAQLAESSAADNAEFWYAAGYASYMLDPQKREKDERRQTYDSFNGLWQLIPNMAEQGYSPSTA